MENRRREEREGPPLPRYDIGKMLAHYRFGPEDSRRLKALEPLMVASLPELLPGFYDFIFSFEHARIFLHNDEILAKHRRGLQRWFRALFGGRYDGSYFRELARISETHVRIGLPPHYVNTAFSYVREYLERLLLSHGRNVEDLASVNKVIDINLDILSLTYREEEQQQLIEDIVLLKNVVRKGTVVPYVQPIVRSSDGVTAKFECLMRLQDPDSGRIYTVFPLIATAKSIHLYEGLMELMVEKSMRVFESLPWSFSLNLSYDDIDNRRFRQYLCHKIREFPEPQQIIFEVLETDFIEDFRVVEGFLSDVRALGCRVAVDDFGAGYSSMENIMRIKPDYIKIDGSLIQEIDRSEESLAIVRSILQMSRELGARTVAEHVHNRIIYEIVRDMGVDYMQGYYLSEPFAADRLRQGL